MKSDADLEEIRGRQQRRLAAPTHDCPDREEVEADLVLLMAELHAARARVRDLTRNEEDLRASAEIWSRLYEAAAARANGAARVCARCARALDGARG